MKKILIYGLVVLALILGVNLIQENSAPKQTQVFSLSDYAYSELEESTIYKANELTVVDMFAQNTHKVNGIATNTTDFYLVTFRDEDDRLVTAILSVDDDDDIYNRLSFYTIDERQGIGDCVVRGYVKTKNNSNPKLTQYFDEALDEYVDLLGENLVSPQWILVYQGTSI